MKRFLIAATAALLLCPMTAYAAQSEEAKAVYQEMMAVSENITDMNAYYDMNIKLSGDSLSQPGSTESIDMRLEMNARMKDLKDPSNMRYQAFMRLSMPVFSETPVEVSMYYANGYYYMDTMGEKEKGVMSLDEMMESVLSTTKMFETSTDYMKDLSVRTEGDNRILSYTIDDSMMNQFLQSYLSSLGMDQMLTGMSINIKNISGSYVIDPNGYYTKMIMSMDMSMSMEGETIQMAITADIGIADPGQPVEIIAPNLNEYTAS